MKHLTSKNGKGQKGDVRIRGSGITPPHANLHLLYLIAKLGKDGKETNLLRALAVCFIVDTPLSFFRLIIVVVTGFFTCCAASFCITSDRILATSNR